MATEPERDIEKLLRTYANKRRNEMGAPLELHPANRRLLQSEAAKRFRSGSPFAPSFFQRLRHLPWPRIAWAVALVAVLAVAWSLLLPARNKGQIMTMSKNEHLKPPSSVDKVQPAPPPAPAPSAAPTAAEPSTP